MKWFRENRFLSTFLIVFGVCTIGAAWFLFTAKSDWGDAAIRFSQAVAELNRLERIAPYPNTENLRKMKMHADDYGTVLAKLKDELKRHILPVSPMAPNEFQSRLRLANTAIVEKARTNKVKLPDRFYLGFDEFASALPSNEQAPLLGQQLAQIELLLKIIIDARVDAVTVFQRTGFSEQARPASVATPRQIANRKSGTTEFAGARLLERSAVRLTFNSTAEATRRVINEIAAADRQLFIIRTLHIRNEKEKGPPRVEIAENATTNGSTLVSDATLQNVKPTASPALNFIVGTERLEASANIELIRSNF